MLRRLGTNAYADPGHGRPPHSPHSRRSASGSSPTISCATKSCGSSPTCPPTRSSPNPRSATPRRPSASPRTFCIPSTRTPSSACSRPITSSAIRSAISACCAPPSKPRRRANRRAGSRAALGGNRLRLHRVPQRYRSGRAQNRSRPRFREKPELPQAKRFVKAGNFYWNAGMFFWKAETLLERPAPHLPKTATLLASLPAFDHPDFAAQLAEVFPLLREHFDRLCRARKCR